MAWPMSAGHDYNMKVHQVAEDVVRWTWRYKYGTYGFSSSAAGRKADHGLLESVGIRDRAVLDVPLDGCRIHIVDGGEARGAVFASVASAHDGLR